MSKVLVVFSGGQDSTTCLGLAVKAYKEVEAVFFTYGQNHAIELGCAMQICEELGVKLHVLSMGVLADIGDSALVTSGDVNAKHHLDENLPASYVPNRNALFLTAAHALAQKIGAPYLMTGVCEADYSGYPDCRHNFIVQLNIALNKGAAKDVVILTPLMNLSKAETWELAEEAGILEMVRTKSHTCYNGVRDTLFDWGYGCAACPACKLREKGWKEYRDGRA